MKGFRVKEYTIYTSKIKSEKGLNFAFLTDMHGLKFGEGNQELKDALKKIAPDAILIAGDMLVRGSLETMETARKLILSLAGKYPVYYALGNHEYDFSPNMIYQKEYFRYEKRLKQQGVVFLHNAREKIVLHGEEICIYGLELPKKYYHKPNSPKLTAEEVEEYLGKPLEENFNILLAHNPKYGKAYLGWGAELTLSGHYHGGVVRLSENHGLSCPQHLFLPPYCCGHFQKKENHMIVSAGLGEHTIPVRINNPRELIVIHIKPQKALTIGGNHGDIS